MKGKVFAWMLGIGMIGLALHFLTRGNGSDRYILLATSLFWATASLYARWDSSAFSKCKFLFLLALSPLLANVAISAAYFLVPSSFLAALGFWGVCGGVFSLFLLYGEPFLSEFEAWSFDRQFDSWRSTRNLSGEMDGMLPRL